MYFESQILNYLFELVFESHFGTKNYLLNKNVYFPLIKYR